MQGDHSGLEHKEALAQESEYAFPYHYITKYDDDNFKQHFVDSWGINYVSTIEFITQRVNKLSPSSVIDVGCGDGRLTRELFLRCQPEKVVGVDYSARAIQLAKAMNAGQPEIEFFAIDITDSQRREQYDLVVLMEVFEHIPLQQAKEFIHAVHALLKPGGKLLLTVPHSNKPVEYKHFQHFTSQDLLAYIAPLFNVDEIMPFEKKGWKRNIIDRLLCNRWFILNNPKLLKAIYRYHKARLFFCEEEGECQRLFMQATAK